MTRPIAAFAAAAVMVVVVACGSGPPSISASATSELAQQVKTVRAAVVAGNRPDAESRLAQLRSEVAALLAGHQITSGRAAQILSAASAVDVELAALTPPSTAPATVVPTTEAPSSSTGDTTDQKGKGKHGKG